MKKKKIHKKAYAALVVGICLFGSVETNAQVQEIQLANEYVGQGDYEKAKSMFQKLAKNEGNIEGIYKNYLFTLEKLNEWNEAEKFLKKQIKKSPENYKFKIDYAVLLENQKKTAEAEKVIEKLIETTKTNAAMLNEIAQYFIEIDKMNWSEKAYLIARKESTEKSAYAFQLAQIYRMQNRVDKMLEEYVRIAEENINNLLYVQNALQDNLQKEEDYQKLEQILIDKIQKDPNQSIYSDLLIWFYIQQKDFTKAFFQARSVDKRMKLEGSKLMEVGLISIQNKEYKSASSIFEYLTKEYPNSPNYPISRRYLILAREELVKNTFPINLKEIEALVNDYQNLIGEMGKNSQTAEAMRNMALLYGFYLDQKDTAIALLQEVVQLAGRNSDLIAKSKLDMGDIYLLKNEPWEATLLYSQVEKSEKEQPLGYEAKLKNAKLSYYKGEFELAQSHLDILKMATSREIANDAMDLSLLIQDNLALDTIGEAMKEYALAELLLFQNKNEMALQKLDELPKKFPNHSLTDEIWWLRAQIFMKENQNQKAVEELEKIVSNYGKDILGDDAHFLIAKLLEEKLGQKEKAMEMYQNHLTKYPGSIYVVEARKRFRQLRGDTLN